MHSQAYKYGDVVLVSFRADTEPFERRRPAVIVSADGDMEGQSQVRLVPFTSKRKSAMSHEKQIFLNMNSSQGKTAGLRMDSIIDCGCVVEVPKNVIVAKIGTVTNETMRQIRELIEN